MEGRQIACTEIATGNAIQVFSENTNNGEDGGEKVKFNQSITLR